MKRTRKLIPAIAMLLISAVMMTTASFAWFSMNTSVTAGGMNVEATTAMNLVISNNGSNGWASQTNAADTTKKTLNPSSTAIPATPSTADLSFFTVPSAGVNPDSGAMKDGAVVTAATSGTDYVKYSFYVKIDGVAGSVQKNLYVEEISVANTPSSAISSALRVAVTAQNADGTDAATSTIYQYIFAPVTGYSATYKGLVATRTAEETSKNVLSADNVTISTAGTNTTLGRVTADSSVKIDVYVWYEGQDASCTTSNSVNVEELAISIKFAMNDTAPTPTP